MKYIGQFRDINEVLFKVEIETPVVGEDEELQMSGEPVVISYESENEQAYKPYKCSTATISFYLKEANFDLIDAFANRVKVKIYRENEVIWCGFSTPNAYSQAYEEYADEFQLECQDGISTLQYYDYEYIPNYTNYGQFDEEHPYLNQNWDKAISTHNKANNFFHLIMKMNEKLGGMYQHIYVSDSIFNPYTRDISVLDSIFISENNFFDEDGEPMKMLDILEEICRYCSLTCFPYGDSLYFISLDAIAIDNTGYFHYTRVNDTQYSSEKINLVSNINIDIDSFSSKGCKISTDSVYNYCKVKDDLYSIETLTPSIEQNRIRTEATDTVGSVGITGVSIEEVETDQTKSNYGEVKIKNEINGDKKQWVFYRFHGYNWSNNLNNRYVFYYYPADADEYEILTENPIELYDSNNIRYRRFTYNTALGLNGACIVDYAVIAVDEWTDDIKSVDFQSAIMMHTTDVSDKDVEHSLGSDPKFADWISRGVQPMFKLLTEPQIMKKNDYIVISGELSNFHHEDKCPIDTNLEDKTLGVKLSFGSYTAEWARLKCGRYYWNGEEWQDTACDFALPFEYKKDQMAFNNFIPIKNTINYTMNIDKEGYCVPCLLDDDNIDNGSVINTIEFTFYRPHSFMGRSKRLSLLRNFDISICGQRDDVINNNADNTEIESVKSINNVSEYDDVNCKICTWFNKGFNWSQTFFIRDYKGEGSDSFYQNGLSFINDDSYVQIGTDSSTRLKITDLLSDTTINPHFIFKTVDYLYDSNKCYIFRPEELIISHNVEQYNNPTLNLEVNLKNSLNIKPYSRFTYDSQFPNFIFAIDSIEYNLRENECQVKLINKKIDYERN